MQRKTQGAGIVKGWEDKQDCRYIPDTFTENMKSRSEENVVGFSSASRKWEPVFQGGTI